MSKLKFLLGSVVSFLIVLVALDAFLRFSGTSSTAIVTDDDALGRVLKPETDFVYMKEGFRLGRVNQYGYIGPAYPPEKDANTVRIVLVGDSYVAGLHLLGRHHFRSILEEGLRRVTGRHVEVLNFGFPAVDFTEMYINYELFAKRFSPDFVIFVVGTGSLNQPMDKNAKEVRPRLVVSGDSVMIDYSFRTSEDFAASKRLNHLRSLGLFSLFTGAKQIWAQSKAPEVLFEKFYTLFEPPKVKKDKQPRKPIEKPKRRPLNRAIVKKLGEARRQGLTTSIIMARGTLPETFIDFVKANDVLYFDPGAKLDSLAQTGIDPNYWAGSQRKGHWNQYAHRVIGAFLVEKMAPLIPHHTMAGASSRDH